MGTNAEAFAALQSELASAADAQAETDLGAILELVREHGAENIRVVEIGYVPGLPCRLAVKTPGEPAMKRFRSQLQPRKDGAPPDAAAAASALGAVCRVYPDAETYAKILAARPGVDLLVGNAAAKLAAEGAIDAGKD